MLRNVTRIGKYCIVIRRIFRHRPRKKALPLLQSMYQNGRKVPSSSGSVGTFPRKKTGHIFPVPPPFALISADPGRGDSDERKKKKEEKRKSIINIRLARWQQKREGRKWEEREGGEICRLPAKFCAASYIFCGKWWDPVSPLSLFFPSLFVIV